ncbi:MAG: hypothetical protein RIF36_14565 [Imperialibacter sp.]|uniref:fluoroquinolone export ABC transporter permease subunit n=1 Tax=Imperialibacter sp. TaxID=2038411 RepID=UPI0032EDD39D
MITLGQQLKWQFILLQKNNIIGISLGVTLIYGIVLYFLRSWGSLNELLVFLVLNDPSVIGYFFVALAIYTEKKHQILPAIFVSPINLHHYLLSKVLSLSIVGLVCSLGLAFSVKGLSFDILSYAIGAFSICVLSALLGIAMLTFADEFLNFAMLSIPVFMVFVNLPVLHYLGAVDLGLFVNIFPVQASLSLIADSLVDGARPTVLSYLPVIIWPPLFYLLAFRLFNKKLIHH